jgi:two-component system, cell cycle response regulator
MEASRARVLVAEDSRSQRSYFVDLLREEGFEVHEAEDGRVALDLCRMIHPDLLILDLELPRLKGSQVLSRLRADRKVSATQVLVLTADEHEGTLAALLDAADFVTKPARPAELLARVRRALREKAELDLLAEHNHTLTEVASSDPLTGLPNRRGSAKALAMAVAETRTSGLPLAVVILDVDEFKLINDTRGHGVGDQVLRAVAGRLSDRSRSGDTVGRWGGDEFIAVLPDARPDVAANEADALREAVGGRTIGVGDDSVIVTVSAGWASSRAATAEELLASADQALYEAKGNGRDCVRPAL